MQKMATSQKVRDLFLKAVTYHREENLNTAAAVYREILAMDADHADSLHLLGLIEFQFGNVQTALNLLEKAVQRDPENAAYLNNLGSILLEKKAYQEAASNLKRAIQQRPDFAEPHYNLGLVFKKLKKLDESVTYLEKAMALKPDMAEALNALVEQLQKMCSWEKLKTVGACLDQLTKERLRVKKTAAENPLITLRRHDDPAYCFAVAQSWSNKIVADRSHVKKQFPPRARDAGTSKIRVGYLSNNFSNHPVAHQIFSLFSLHDRHRFEIFCYSYGSNDHSWYREQIQDSCDHFFDLFETGDLEAAEIINAHALDILVDLVGHTEDNRIGICALRPAPIQVSYLGFLGTTGAPFYDYFITDTIVTPPAHGRYYSENLVYLPHCYQVNSILPVSSKKWTRQDVGLPEEAFVFCSFNSAYKIEQVLFDAWIDILRRVPKGVLWLLKDNHAAEQNLRNYAEDKGLKQEDLVFSERAPLDEHLGRLSLADLALDTLTYNGGATTSNALWAGIPVLTVQGNHFVSRMSSSALKAVGLDDLVTHSLSAYTEQALRLANDEDALINIKQRLKENLREMPLFDIGSFCHNLESAYQDMMGRYIRGKLPGQINITGEERPHRV
jgi:protein O-GlcNAc transferase